MARTDTDGIRMLGSIRQVSEYMRKNGKDSKDGHGISVPYAMGATGGIVSVADGTPCEVVASSNYGIVVVVKALGLSRAVAFWYDSPRNKVVVAAQWVDATENNLHMLTDLSHVWRSSRHIDSYQHPADDGHVTNATRGAFVLA